MMTTTDTNLQNLIINDLSQSDYESITPNANELYLTDEVIESSDIITALGYTPYNASNPAGYTSNVGTVTSVNNTSPDSNGNVALTIPTIDIDNTTITTNANDELQAVALIDNNTSNAIKTWAGTRAQYDAIVTKDSNTLYNITDDTDVTLSLLELLYPVGAIYIGTMSTCPLAVLGVGTWVLKAADRVLQGAGTRGSVGTTVNESLPNIKGTTSTYPAGSYYGDSGAFSRSNLTGSNSNTYAAGANNLLLFDASRVSSTYQDNAPVQQDAYLVNIWERIS